VKLVTVEFYGPLRTRSGRAAITLPAGSVLEALAGVERACPALQGLLLDEQGQLRHDFRVAIDGLELVDTGDRDLREGSILALLHDHGRG
jgi:hypothetical protein